MPARTTAAEPTVAIDEGAEQKTYQASDERLAFDIRVKALELAVNAGQFDTVDSELAAAEKYRTFLANDGQPVANEHVPAV